MSQHYTEPYDPIEPQYQPQQDAAAAQPALLSPRAQRRAQKAAQRRQRRGARSRSLIVRRLIAVALMIGIFFSIYYVLFHTHLADPLLAMIGPAQQWLAWVRADPSRVFGALALMILPYMGTYSFLFERRG